MKPKCMLCGESFAPKRLELGYRVCLDCGDSQAIQDRQNWCVAPMHKSNYVLITDRKDLLGINNKGGLIK